MNVIDKINAISFFTLKASFIKSLFNVLFYRASFAFVLQRLRAKPIPLKMHKTKGSLREGAVSEAD
jgi:hypothetical protein